MTPISERKRALQTRLADLNIRLGRIEDELESARMGNLDDLATEREGDEVLETMGMAGQREMRMIEAALQRVQDGNYGQCARCGADIGQERLDLLPATPFCAQCAAVIEREHSQ